FPQYFGDQPGTNGPVYVGALICALFLLGCVVVKGPVKWALLLITILTVWLSWGHNMMWLTDLFIDHFPMYNRFRTVSSMLVVAELIMPILAVLALQKVLTEKDFMKQHSRAFYGAFAVSAGLCLLLWLVPSLMGSYSKGETEQFVLTGQLQQLPTLGAAVETIRHSMVSSDAMRSLFVLLVGFGVLWAYLSGKIKARAEVVSLVITLVVLVDMYAVNKRYINADSFISRNDVTAATDYTPRPADTQILQDTAMNYRVLDRQHFMEAMPSYFHKAVGGYHAAKLTRYNDLIERQIANGNIQVLNMLNTKYVIIDDNTVQQNPMALGNAWFVDSLTYVNSANDEMAFLNSFNPAKSAVADKKFAQALNEATPAAQGDTIFETSYAPNRLTYHSHSANGGVAVFSEVYFPWGWTATVDGKEVPIGRVNYVLRALQLPAGDHSVEFKFEPKAVSTSDTIATWAIVAIYVLLLLALNVAVFKGLKTSQKEAEKKKAQ
ncbi:MAG: YfhO family protein, partial [Muribaculaceae bacterium]|nr:YfhO family protein [Muribaculaceae bacterium]